MRARLPAAVVLAAALAASAQAAPPHRVPDDLVLVDLAGRTWTREALAGRVVLFDFWATWCAPCVRERSRLARLRAAHSERELVILSVNLDHADRRSLVSWLNRRRLDWPQLHEPLGWASPLAAAFGVEAVPWKIVYGADGGMVGTDVTAVDAALAPVRREAAAEPHATDLPRTRS